VLGCALVVLLGVYAAQYAVSQKFGYFQRIYNHNTCFKSKNLFYIYSYSLLLRFCLSWRAFILHPSFLPRDASAERGDATV